jgi:Flagellar basal body-associated protein
MVTVLVGCGSKEAKTYTFDPGDAFITSVANSKSLMKTDITIELTSQTTLEFLTANTYKVRDIIINILRNQTYADIDASDSQNIIKKKILDALRKNLEVTGIDNIYFNEFVVQQ